MSNVLIIDALSLFTRSFVAFPAMTGNGEAFGGTIGFLKTLRKIVQDTQPTGIYIVWESGGSQRRRAIFPAYKLNRRPERLNRYYEDDIPETEENRSMQIRRLLEYLKCLPVCQLYASDCEADDIIAHLCCSKMREHDKTIASSDKDMYQLLNEKTRVYNLHKKIYTTADDVLKEFNVSAKNFAIAKALAGDISDNIPGIKGIGFKTIAKKFPFLASDNEILIQDVLDFSASHVSESKTYKSVIDNTSDLKRNWKLVLLNGGMVSSAQITKVDHVIDTFTPVADKIKFIRNLIGDGVGDFDAHSYFHTFIGVEGLSFKSE